MKRLVWSELGEAGQREALARPAGRTDPAVQAAVRAIVDDVRRGGWEAAVRHALRLDGAAPERVNVAPIAEEARRTLSTAQLRAIDLARRNIVAFHKGSVPAEHVVETMPGLVVRKVWRPLDRVGLYVPGGATPLFSTLLMLALPARAAGVKEILVATPPRPEGGLAPLIALAADLCGINSVWTIGGAQAVAALGFGAGDIPACPKVCGPGNAFVAEAKTYAASLPGGPAIDMPAGPSELLIIADAEADPELVAADLLSQAEHDAAAQVLLVTPSPELADRVASRLAAIGRRPAAAGAGRSVARKCPHPARRHARRGGRDRQSLRARASVARGCRSGRAARPGPQCRRRLCRRPGGRDVRRLSRRIEPRIADRRRRPRLERGFGLQLPQGDQRPDVSRPRRRAPSPGRRPSLPGSRGWRRMPGPPTPGSRSRRRHDLAR